MSEKQKPPSLQVIVAISGGVGELLYKSQGVAVAMYDYDIESVGENASGVTKDPDGNLCCIRQWEPSDEIIGPENWPVIKQAREGSYRRTWKCPSCSRLIDWSYQELAEAGLPICRDCDLEMEMLL